MPSKANCDDPHVIATRRAAHMDCFTKACQGARTLHEVMDLMNHGTALPSYAHPDGTDAELVLAPELKEILNETPHVLTVAGETYETADSQLQFRLFTMGLKDWQRVIETLGEPLSNDDPETWELHDLVILHTIAIGVIAKVVNRTQYYYGAP